MSKIEQDESREEGIDMEGTFRPNVSLCPIEN